MYVRTCRYKFYIEHVVCMWHHVHTYVLHVCILHLNMYRGTGISNYLSCTVHVYMYVQYTYYVHDIHVLHVYSCCSMYGYPVHVHVCYTSTMCFLARQTRHKYIALHNTCTILIMTNEDYRYRYRYCANICRRILEESQFFTRGAPIFQGETYSNRNSVSLLARFLLAGKIAGKEARQQNVAVAENNYLSLKKARMLRCAVGETQETGWSWPAIFFQTQK